MKPKIVIERKREFASRLPYYIFLEGKKVGVSPYGRTVVFDVNPGEHTLQLKIEWIGSPVVSIRLAEDEVKTYRVSLFPFGNWLFPVVIIVSAFGFIARHTIEMWWVGLIALPFLLLIVYYITFGRHRYLQLESK